MANKSYLGYKSTCFIAGSVLVITSLSVFMKGLANSMSQFAVPTHIIQSAHYLDAIAWVYIHMTVIGVLIMLFGYAVTDVYKQKWVVLVLLLAISFYTYLDFIHSDSALGNALYKGSTSVIPALISMMLSLLFLQLCIRLFLKG